jgi:hypothetical protein
MQEKTFVLEQETTMSTYKCMKVGVKQRIVSCCELFSFFNWTICSNLKCYMLFIMLQG